MTQYAAELPSGASNYMRNVAIVGVSGTIGSEVTKELLQTGQHKVTAISRVGSKAEVPAGVEVKRVDYDNHESIVEALRGQDILVISMSVTAPRDTQGKLIAAAKDAGLQWVMPNEWGYGFNDPEDQLAKDIFIGVGTAKTRAYIKQLSLNFIGLQCGFWEDFSLAGGEERYGFDIPGRKFTMFDDGNTKINSSSLPFCGVAVAKILSLPILPQDKDDKSVTISKWRDDSVRVSAFHMSQNERFESLLRVTGTKKLDWTISHEGSQKRFDDAVARMNAGDMSAFGIRLYTRIFVPDGKSDFSDKLDNDLLQLPKVDLDEMTAGAVKVAMTGGVKY